MKFTGNFTPLCNLNLTAFTWLKCVGKLHFFFFILVIRHGVNLCINVLYFYSHWCIISNTLCISFSSVKLKHFEKFQDTTEALAGNCWIETSTPLVLYLWMQSYLTVLQLCVYDVSVFLTYAWGHQTVIRHYLWDHRFHLIHVFLNVRQC